MWTDRLQFFEIMFKKTLQVFAVLVCVLLGGIFLTLLVKSLPAIVSQGIRFVTGKEWDPVMGNFGAIPFVEGTLITSFVALLISIPFSLSIAIFLGEYFKQTWFSSVIKSIVELLAGIPSVVYGFFGLFVLVPFVRSLETPLGITPYGVGIFSAALILALMIVPYSASMSREVIALVPSDLKEAAYSLGATRYEVLRYIILPYASSGIFAGTLLALGRAMGETMAVTMVIGNSNLIPESLFGPGNTMASVIANEFTEATDKVHLASLIELGLYLFVITVVINSVGRYIISKFTIETQTQ